MTIFPKKTKFNKSHKLFQSGVTCRRSVVSFGNYGLKIMECGRITANQLKATKLVLTKKMKSMGGKVWMRVFPDIPVTKKPAETRMGSGKGPVEFWATTLKAGVILFEIDCPDHAVAVELIKSAAYKLPLKTEICQKYKNIIALRN